MIIQKSTKTPFNLLVRILKIVDQTLGLCFVLVGGAAEIQKIGFVNLVLRKTVGPFLQLGFQLLHDLLTQILEGVELEVLGGLQLRSTHPCKRLGDQRVDSLVAL